MPQKQIFQLKIILHDSPPVVWVRIQIPSVLTVADLLVVVHYSMMVIHNHFLQFKFHNIYKLPIKDKSIIQNQEIETIISSEKELTEIFHEKNGESSLIRYVIVGNQIYYQIELEKTLFPEKSVCYPICIGGYLLLHSNVEIQFSKEFFELKEKTAKEFIEPVFRNSYSRQTNKNGPKRFYNPVSESTLSSWNLWFLKVLQGGFDQEDLLKDFESILTKQDVEELYNCILHKPLKLRNKAICILSLFKGIPKKYICEYLGIKRGTLDGFIEKYKSGGVKRLLTHQTLQKTKKYEIPFYTKEVFSILHSPPSCHGFNRTTWKLSDIQEVMAIKNLPIHKRYISKIINNAGYKVTKARKRLTSNDPDYKEKLKQITDILSNLGTNEKFFSIDEYGPFGVKLYGGRSLAPPGEKKTIPQWQKSKGSLIITAGLELSTNQITHFYSEKKNTSEMIKLLNLLIEKYRDEDCIYFSWDAASWHASKKLRERVDEINSDEFKKITKSPIVELAPLPTCAQFLNVIESVFSGMAKAIIHNSDYQSVEECKTAIDRYFSERNEYFQEHPKRAGNKIWGKERVKPTFKESNNCKDPAYR